MWAYGEREREIWEELGVGGGGVLITGPSLDWVAIRRDKNEL